METFIREYETEKYHLNSLIASTVIPNLLPDKYRQEHRFVDEDKTNGLHMMSGLYMYTNPPPYGYGTPAPKVAETVLRSYEYNEKPEAEKANLHLFGMKVDDTRRYNVEDFNSTTTTNNYCPMAAYAMSKSFLLRYCEIITDVVNKTIENFATSKPDILSAGRQTWDPAAKKSITCPKAFSRFLEIIHINLGIFPNNCIQFVKSIYDLMELEELSVKVREIIVSNKLKYNRRTRMTSIVTKKRIGMRDKVIRGKENVLKWIIDYNRSFCSYIKHAERGKKDRRAIASPSIPMRIHLKIVETFHLELSKRIDGATISIGGIEKLDKITNELKSVRTKQVLGAGYGAQATEDATKWNECLSPGLFNLFHLTLFSEELRKQVDLPAVNENEKFFAKICSATFTMLSVKRIHLGSGFLMNNDTEYVRRDWEDLDINELNDASKEWYTKALPYLDDKDYLFASGGFLMGMLNAGSTTIGLLASNYMESWGEDVHTLRSSDDSMTNFCATTPFELERCINKNTKLLKLLGINLSKSKTFYFPEGYGEYTSQFQDGDFVGQCGVETSSLKPGGHSTQEDFDAVATSARILLRSFAINPFGALARIYIGVDNVRRLWRVPSEIPDEFAKIPKNVVFLSNGSENPWDLLNIGLDESSIRYMNMKASKDAHAETYFYNVMNQDNPFSSKPEERIAFSKATGCVTVTSDTNPVNIFKTLRRSNRTINNATSEAEAQLEKDHKVLFDIVGMLEPSILLKMPTSAHKLKHYIKGLIHVEKQNLDLNDEENMLISKALDKIDGIGIDGSDSEEEGADYMMDDDLDESL